MSKDLPQELLLELFRYKGGKLYRRKPTGARCRPLNQAIGNLDTKGHLRISIWHRKHAVHRVIWIMHHGPIPDGLVIDHINQIKTDNRIENLRAVTPQENMRNMKRRIDNRTGTSGVRWNEVMKKWEARIVVKHPAYIYLGSYETKAEAIAARRAAELCLGYHPNHGKKRATPVGVARAA